MENELQEAKAALNKTYLFNIKGNVISLKDKKSSTGTLSYSGKKYLLNVSGQQVELGEQIDSIAISIIEKRLRFDRALGI